MCLQSALCCACFSRHGAECPSYNEKMIFININFRALMRVKNILQRQRVEPEHVANFLYRLRVAKIDDINPANSLPVR